jgi:acyl-ACP thioesterase
MYEISRTVGCSNVGTDGKITVGSIIDFMQDCCNFQLNSFKILTEYFNEYNIGMYLVSRQININRVPEYSENLKIKTWIYECKNMYGYRNTIIYDEEEIPCIKSYATGAFVNLSTSKPIRMPDDILRSIPIYEKFPMEYLSRKIEIPNNEAKIENPLTVMKYHLDYNKHVNNSKYVTIAEEYLPENFNAVNIRVEYKSSAKYKDILIPLIYSVGKNIIINLCNEQGKAYAIIEFIKN